MKNLYNIKLCYFLKIDDNKEYHLSDIIKLFDKYKYKNGYFIHEKIINLFNENNIFINWKYVDEKKFIKLISSLQIKQNKFITKFKSNDVGILVQEIII
jgi:hypothetical protein